MSKNAEIWKAIPFAPQYQVSSIGNLKSIKRTSITIKDGIEVSRVLKERPIAERVNNCGYTRVTLYIKGALKSYSMHRLVASLFIPNPDNKRTVNHINGNKRDNRVENLEWNTHQENVIHSYRTGLKTPTKGSQFKRKLNDDQVRQIKTYKWSGKTKKEIAAMFNVHRVTIHDIYNERTWRHIQ